MCCGERPGPRPRALLYTLCVTVCDCAELRVHTRGRRTFSYLHDDDSAAGRTFSRMEHSDVARLKPMTPLRPLMQASVKPPSPLLAHEQQPLKPVTPLQPKNTPKTPISHPQRRRRFQTTAHLACGIQLHHQQAPMRPPPENSHAIRLGKVSIKYENVAIPTPIIQISKYDQGNCMRNWVPAQECGK